MRVFYSSQYEIPLPGHIWPTTKYRLTAERIAGPSVQLVDPTTASWEDLALVHTSEYLEKVRSHRLSADEIATLELPWAPDLADAFRLMVGGTYQAAAASLEDGAAAHLGGGLHHAFANHGEGFCLFNDVAVAIRMLQREGRIRRTAVVDCDVHHGNGTAMIFERDPDVFTFSIHQQHNYPMFKPKSDLDVGLENGATDERYLSALANALPRVIASSPELIVYLAGADPFEGDRLGGLAVSKKGLAERDAQVIRTARAANIPLVTVLAGGYALDVRDTVEIHAATIAAMLAVASDR